NADLAADLLVLARDRLQVIELVDRALDRFRAEQHLDDRGVVRLVDLDQPAAQLADGLVAVAPELREPAALEGAESGELVPPALVQRQVALENGQSLRDVADFGL